MLVPPPSQIIGGAWPPSSYAYDISLLLSLQSQSDPVKVRHQKDVTLHTYKNDHRATVALENRVRKIGNK